MWGKCSNQSGFDRTLASRDCGGGGVFCLCLRSRRLLVGGVGGGGGVGIEGGGGYEKIREVRLHHRHPQSRWWDDEKVIEREV